MPEPESPRGISPWRLRLLLPPRRRQPLVWVLGAGIAGILLADAYPAPGAFIMATAGVTAGLVLAWMRAQTRKWVPAGILLLVAAGIGLRAATVFETRRAQADRFPPGERVPVLAVGTVVETPVALPDPEAGDPWGDLLGTADGAHVQANDDHGGGGFQQRALFHLDVREYRAGFDGGHALPGGGERVRVYTDARNPGIHGGQRVRVPLILTTERPPGTPGEFDYGAHLRAQGIARVALWRANIPAVVEAEPSPWDPRTWATAVRDRFADIVRDALPGARASLLQTLTVGIRAGLDPDLKRAFLETGTVHLLVVSGLHVGFLVLVLEIVLLRLGLSARQRAAVMVVFLLFFWLVCGPGARVGVKRAVIMGLFWAGTRLLNRRGDLVNGLAGAALVVLLLEPHDLFTAGFVLSFLSVFWLARLKFLAQFVRRRDREPELLASVRSPGEVMLRWTVTRTAEAFAISLTIFIGTGPLVARWFNRVTPGSLLMNVLAIPLMLWILTAGMAVLLLATLSALLTGIGVPTTGIDTVAGFAAQVADVGQLGLVALVTLIARQDWVSLPVPTPSLWWVIAWEGVLLALTVPGGWRTWKRARKRLALAFLLLGLAGIVGLYRARQPRSVQIALLDVGHGACTVCTDARAKCIVVDPGSMGSGRVGERVIAPYLWQRGIARIDALVLTHPQFDHAGGAGDLLRLMPVGRVIVPPGFRATGSHYLTEARAQGVPIVEACAGQVLRGFEGFEIHVWGPLANVPPAEGTPVTVPSSQAVNEISLVLAIKGEFGTVVLPGDAEDYAQDALLQAFGHRDPGPVRALVMPHHGAHTDTLPRLLDWLHPETALIGRGDPDIPDATRDALASRRIPAYDTWTHGTITLRFTADGPVIQTYRE